jgi:AP-1 complex subunit beta-1
MHSSSRPRETVSSGGSVYFQNSKNTEIAELQSELNSMKPDQQKEAMKQIIASMTIGKDVSALFPHVVKCMRTSNIELKKLIYLYIINYAKAKPDLTFLAVAAFQTDATDKSSPLIRALAVRTMGCIRVNMIVSYLCETLTNSLKDEDAYVRKTAAMCVAKLYNTNPGLVKENGFINTLVNMLGDGNAIVVANALSALTEISLLSGENLIKIRSKTLKRILLALNEANEWGQVYILDALTTFTPKKPKQAEDIIESVQPRLSHSNPSVVMSAVKVILKFLDNIESIESVRNYCKKLSNSLMTIMMAGPEIQYVLLRSLHAVVQKRPLLLDKDFKFFFVQYNDPIYVKLEKIDILYKLCDNKNYENIINEFKSYAIMEFDAELVKKSIK